MIRLGILKNCDLYAEDHNGKSRQHARADGHCKQRDGKSKKKSKRNARDKKTTVTEMEDA